MRDAAPRVRALRDPLGRVEQLLRRDFPRLDSAVGLSLNRRDLEDGSARAQVLPAEDLPAEPGDGFDFMAFPAYSEADGLALLFEDGDLLFEELRRFYLPPVVFAGAGPGGVDALTVAATQAIGEADVILVDSLCGEEVLQFAQPTALIVPVGKRGGDTTSARQEAINDRLLREALHGRNVVRLKGGDPSIFGRLEEEIDTLTERHLPYRVLPGIGAASAAAAFLGKPLTVREIASELVLSTGRLAGGGKNTFPLQDASTPAIALYMSRKVLDSRMRDLTEAGVPASTPVAIVEKLGSPSARTVVGTIETIADIADHEAIGTPAVVLVGAQYETPRHLPLLGLRIWLPAEKETAETHRRQLEALGATCVRVPLIEPVTLPVEEGALLSRPFEWVLFTSKKSVDFFFELLAKWGHDSRWLPRVAAIGDPAVEKLRARGVEPDLVPPKPTRASLSEALIAQGLAGQRILIPASAVAPDGVREALQPHAAEVVRADLYTLRFPRVETVPDADVVLFSSESTVRAAEENGLIEAIKERGMQVGGIGPHCHETIERVGLTLSIVPDGTEPAALARATRRYFARKAVAATLDGEGEA